MEYDFPPGVAASPPREPGVPPRDPGVPELSLVIWSTGIEARPRGLSRFDTPPHGDTLLSHNEESKEAPLFHSLRKGDPRRQNHLHSNLAAD